MTKAKARTTPSPGTTITLGATSIEIPIAKIKQPIKSDINFTIMVSGSKADSKFMLTSMKKLNMILATICKNCIGSKSRRKSTISIKIKIILKMKVVKPKLKSVYSRLKM